MSLMKLPMLLLMGLAAVADVSTSAAYTLTTAPTECTQMIFNGLGADSMICDLSRIGRIKRIDLRQLHSQAFEASVSAHQHSVSA